eukprot:TRINITY_DN80164_c0_g1_i1.p1 TRINITY_DN80164_c0_g1~~TRINITY_DN80164_c0_g1_i1.p1  ORF type:complete len:433 (-),score=87.68 TRINITY_DN80164_c0_g1_i1:48-1346(-)
MMISSGSAARRVTAWQSIVCRSFVRVSAARRGQGTDDLTMGERAAARTNKMLDKIGGMYVGKNIGYSKKYADSYDKIFGKPAQDSAPKPGGLEADFRDVEFSQGPLGLEIEWSVPPLVAAVVPGGAGERAGITAGRRLLRINGRDVTAPLPELELDHLIQQRPLCLSVSCTEVKASAAQGPADVVRRLGYAKLPGVLSPQSSSDLWEFVRAERRQCIAEMQERPAAAVDLFSNVPGARAEEGAHMTRWDMRLPAKPAVYNALMEMLAPVRAGDGSSGLGEVLEDLTGGRDAELWELGVAVSEPGAAPQAVHHRAPECCLFTACVALQDIEYDMGPTHFLPGTNTSVAHSSFDADPPGFVDSVQPAAPLLSTGDALLFDAGVLHCDGHNVSDRVRPLFYATFRHTAASANVMATDTQSIRSALKGRFRLRHFR